MTPTITSWTFDHDRGRWGESKLTVMVEDLQLRIILSHQDAERLNDLLRQKRGSYHREFPDLVPFLESLPDAAMVEVLQPSDFLSLGELRQQTDQ